MARQIKTVTVAGATGNVGAAVVKALLATDKFVVTALTRKEGAAFPAGVTVKAVDFASVEALTAALKGQDAVIDATQSPDIDTPQRLIDAAAAAGVYRVVPSDFGLDPANPKINALPVFARKVASLGRLREQATKSGLTWTVVANGGFLDLNLASGFAKIDLHGKKAVLMDDGANVVPWTTLPVIGAATAEVLLHPAETENRPVYIHSVYKSQKEMVELAKEALGADGWETTSQDAAQVFDKSMADFKAGIYSREVFGGMIHYAQSRPEYTQPWAKDDNELLGVKEMSDEEVRELIKGIAAKKN